MVPPSQVRCHWVLGAGPKSHVIVIESPVRYWPGQWAKEGRRTAVVDRKSRGSSLDATVARGEFQCPDLRASQRLPVCPMRRLMLGSRGRSLPLAPRTTYTKQAYGFELIIVPRKVLALSCLLNLVSGLSAQLEQSPFLSLISDERIAQTLARMAQPKDARFTKELTREVCQRTANAALKARSRAWACKWLQDSRNIL